MQINIAIPAPNEKQIKFLEAKKKFVGFGGARGGGKSWSVRTKAKLLALKYRGIKQLIIRKTYPELIKNHIEILRKETLKIAKYNDKDKTLKFYNGSTIDFMYCIRDSSLDRLQGTEYDIIYIDEATQLSEFQIKSITACCRGVNDFPKRVYMTCNPGGQGHGYIKRVFIEKNYREGEDAEDYEFIQSLVTDNTALMKSNPGYIKQLDALPEKTKQAWRYGNWDIFEGQFFDDFIENPMAADIEKTGIPSKELKRIGRYCHVIAPIDLSTGDARSWNIYRSYDFGYNKPFSCAWWAVDWRGTLYRILEMYGCGQEANEGVRWTPDKQAQEIARIEHEHPWLIGKDIQGIADPSIWDRSRGDSVADTMMRHGIYFTPGDNNRIAGWMQCHYRLQFDEEGYPRMYVFENCKGFIRTIPTLQHSTTRPEDLDTTGEDHIADEWRYMMMSRPIAPIMDKKAKVILNDPLNQFE